MGVTAGKACARESALILVHLEHTSGREQRPILPAQQGLSSGLCLGVVPYGVFSVRAHHSKSIRMTSRSCQGCLPPLPSGDFCIHTTRKGIRSYGVDGNLMGRCVPKQREQVRRQPGQGNPGRTQSKSRRRQSWKESELGCIWARCSILFMCFILKIVENQPQIWGGGGERRGALELKRSQQLPVPPAWPCPPHAPLCRGPGRWASPPGSLRVPPRLPSCCAAACCSG